jgi:hypothetical protein
MIRDEISSCNPLLFLDSKLYYLLQGLTFYHRGFDRGCLPRGNHLAGYFFSLFTSDLFDLEAVTYASTYIQGAATNLIAFQAKIP